jgi:hypothetical protein
VQAKLPTGPKTEQKPKAIYPLSGLVHCDHCGKTMTGNSAKYVCTTYLRHGRQNNTGCGKHKIDAPRIQAWLVDALRRHYLGPGRTGLVEGIKRELKAEAKTCRGDQKRLEKRATELDREISRLVRAIRTTDAPELVMELNQARAERQSVQDALQHAGRFHDGQTIDQEAESVADKLWGLEEGLSSSDPALVREVFRRLVERIECRWKPVPNGGEGKCQHYRLTGGVVYLRDPLVAVTCACHAKA